MVYIVSLSGVNLMVFKTHEAAHNYVVDKAYDLTTEVYRFTIERVPAAHD